MEAEKRRAESSDTLRPQAGALGGLRSAAPPVRTGMRPSPPPVLPAPTPASVTSPYIFQNYLNICAFGYSTPFWHYERWQEEVDWMALNGVLNPLAMVGQDALWLDTFVQDFGLPREELLVRRRLD